MDQKVRKLKGYKHRIETGAVQFGDDWPGLFIRGDDAFYLRQILESILEYIPENMWAAKIFFDQYIKTINNDVIPK